MAVGEFENISAGPAITITLNRLGWTLGPGDIIAFDNDDDFRDDLSLVQEVEDYVASGDLEVRDGGAAVVPLNLIQDFLRGDNITTGELQAQAVTKTKIDISTPGEASITNVIAGTGVTITETGADTGTGAVTINSAAGSDKTYMTFMAHRDEKLEKSGIQWFQASDKTPHNDVGFYIPKAGILRYMWMTADKTDNSEDWQLRLYRNPTTGSRVNEQTFVLVTSQRTWVSGVLNVNLVAGEYGLAGRRNGGASDDSNFEYMQAGIIVETDI